MLLNKTKLSKTEPKFIQKPVFITEVSTLTKNKNNLFKYLYFLVSLTFHSYNLKSQRIKWTVDTLHKQNLKRPLRSNGKEETEIHTHNERIMEFLV